MSIISMDLDLENKLLNEAKKDRKHFSKIYEHYHPHIKRYFLSKTSNEQTAEDLSSTVFEKCLKSLDNFQWQGVSFSAWLYKIAGNTLVDFYRASKKENKLQDIESNEHKLFVNTTPDVEFEQDEESRALKRLLDSLPKREKEIVYMKFFDGYSNITISKILNISETNVGTIVYRALKKLRDEQSKL